MGLRVPGIYLISCVCGAVRFQPPRLATTLLPHPHLWSLPPQSLPPKAKCPSLSCYQLGPIYTRLTYKIMWRLLGDLEMDTPWTLALHLRKMLWKSVTTRDDIWERRLRENAGTGPSPLQLLIPRAFWWTVLQLADNIPLVGYLEAGKMLGIARHVWSAS